MDSILELLKSIPIVGWVIGGVAVLIGVKFVSKKGLGGSSGGGISIDGILGNLRNNRGRTERAGDDNRDATESVDNAGDRIEESKRVVADTKDTVDRAGERVIESRNVNDDAISAVDTLSDGLGDSKDQLSRAKSIIERIRSRKSAN